MKHFASSLTRGSASGDAPDATRRSEPSAKQLAMATADQLKAYYQKTGKWVGADQEALADMRNRDPSGLRRW